MQKLNYILCSIVMDTCPPPHHVTRRNGVVKVSIVTINPATVETIVQTHSCNVKIKVLKVLKVEIYRLI